MVVTIDGSTTSGSKPIQDFCVVGILLPSSMSGSKLNAKCSTDNSNFGDCFDNNGTQWEVTFNAGRYIDLTMSGEAICGADYIKLVSDASETSTTYRLQLARP